MPRVSFLCLSSVILACCLTFCTFVPVFAADITYPGYGLQASPDIGVNNSLFPGTTASPVASNNTVTINGTPGINDITGYVHGGIASGWANSNVTGNHVTMNSGTVNGDISGGYASSYGAFSTASNNTVDINNGTGGSIRGGYASHSDAGSSIASGNTVNISNGTVDWVYGGYANSAVNATGDATASGNIIVISGGIIGGYVHGGHAHSYSTGSATASNNTVTISGGILNNDVYAGIISYGTDINSATATDNIITISGNPTFGVSTRIYGGSAANVGDAFTGNTLNKNSDAVVPSAYNFEFINFGYSGNANIGYLNITPTGSTKPGVQLNTNANNINFDGVIEGSGSLTKLGTGALSLAGANTYTGNTVISGGKLLVSGSLGYGSYAGSITNSGELEFNQNSDQTLSGAISGPGSLAKSGSGALTLNGANSMSSVNLDAGALNLSSGASAAATTDFTVGNNSSLGLAVSASPVITTGGTFSIGTGTTLNVTGYGLSYPGTPQTIISGTNSGTFSDVTVAGVSTGTTNSFLDVNLIYNASSIQITTDLSWNRNFNAHGTFNIMDGETFTLDTVLADNTTFTPNTHGWDGKSLSKTGAGTLILNDTNTYSGDTSVAEGTLSIASDSNIGGGTNTLAGGTLLLTGPSYAKAWTFSGTNNSIATGSVTRMSDTTKEMSGVLSGTGGFTKTGTGILALSGSNTYSGGTTISEGILLLANAQGAGSGAIANNTLLELVFDGTLNNNITGSGDLLANAGAGNTSTLAGTNSYTGMTTVQSGILALGSDLTTSSGLTLYRGTTFKQGTFNHSLDNKSLTVWENASYDGNLSARGATMNFITPGATTDTILSVTGTADINSSNANVGVTGNTILPAGTRLSLIKAAGGLTGAATLGDGSGILQAGATVVHNITLQTTANELLAIVDGGSATKQTKALSEGFLAGMTNILQGADVIAGQGMDAAVRATRAVSETGADGYGIRAFGTLSGGSVTYNTGSHIDMHSVNLLTGLAYGTDLSIGRLTAGAFFEYGNGSYDTHNSFSNAASVDGKGDTHYLGGGIIGRMDFQNTGPGHIYVETSGRAGKVHNDYDSSDLRDANGRKASYDSSAPYYGLHAGTGYIWNITEKAALDLHGKYFWTHQEGDNVNLSTGENVRFKGVDSHRLRLGSRLSYTINEYVSPYIGAAWEHEFGGKSRASTNGFSIDAPSLEGSIGVGELGLSLKPSATLPLSFDIGVQGYTGKREGVTGSLQVKLEF